MSNSMGDRPERGTSKRAATMEKKGGGERVGGEIRARRREGEIMTEPNRQYGTYYAWQICELISWALLTW